MSAEEAGVRRLTHLGHDDFSRADVDPLETDHRSLRRTIEASSTDWGLTITRWSWDGPQSHPSGVDRF
jgi:hypothetical protein